MAKVFKILRPPAQLPKSFPVELERAQRLLKQQEEIKRGLTWDIGRQIVDPQMSVWLCVGVLFKVLMGAPGPLQVLALSDAARGMAKGGDEGHQLFITAIGNCFFFFCMEKLLQFLARITMIRGEFLFTQRLQRKVYSKMLQQDYEFFDGKPTANLQNLVHESTKQVCNSLIFVKVRLIQVVATVFFQVVLIAWRFPQLALIVNMSLPVAGALRYYAKAHIERAGARLKARGNLVGQRTWDVLSNLPTVRSHCRERGAVEDYTRCVAYQARLHTKLDIFNGVTQPFMHFCDMICVYVGYYYGGQLIRMGLLTTAELMTVIRQFQTVALELAHMLDTISGSMLATEHGRDVLELLLSRPKIEPDLFPAEEGKDEEGVAGAAKGQANGKRRHKLENTRVEYREVVFAYPGAKLRAGSEDDVRVLRGLSFTAMDGQFTALVGKTGCGKSTVTHLLQRLYDVDQGCVLVGGVDVREQEVHTLRRSIAVVSQEPVLFHASIHENLLYALQDEDGSSPLEALEKERLMVEACKRADAWEFVNALPEGLRTDIGPRGSQLSGGQKQRLTIARAILKDAPLLVLDEATSSLDVEAEQAVQQALDSLICAGIGVGGRPVTRLVVAHRLSTVRRADKIVAIQGGVMREQGTHEELLALGGTYARFLRLSTGGGLEDALISQEASSPRSSREAPSPDARSRRGHDESFPRVCAAVPEAAAAEAAIAQGGANGKEASVPETPEAPEAPEALEAQAVQAAQAVLAMTELRNCFAALRLALGADEGAGGGGSAGAEVEALADEVERCQQRLSELLEGR